MLLDRLAADDLEAMVEAGRKVLDCRRVLANTGDNVVGELLKDHETFYEWNHYPEGDVYDPLTHAQFYYHAHPGAQRRDEHGHFHTFLQPKGMPSGIRPASLQDFAPPDDKNDALSHIVAVSMDHMGAPLRLFTTNRWVTGEVWYEAEDVVKLLEKFTIDIAQPSWPVNLWVSNMLVLFRPQIVELIHARDAAIANWARAHPDRNVYEDRELEVTSVAEISVEAQLKAVRSALSRRERSRRS